MTPQRGQGCSGSCSHGWKPVEEEAFVFNPVPKGQRGLSITDVSLIEVDGVGAQQSKQFGFEIFFLVMLCLVGDVMFHSTFL